LHFVDGDQIESTHKASRIIASGFEHGVIIQGHVLALFVDELTDERSLATLAGADQHDHGGVRKRSGHAFG
jgi:hypothetical protein